ncbi:MAG TPA: hypothetical protein EYP34_00395 [Chromatiaceae bacterium]|nr:hypothetical protein [Chromatiaceae bacterium]
MKIFSSKGQVLVVLLSVLLLSGCGTVSKARKNQSMDIRLREYAHEVRWGALEALPTYLAPEMIDAQPPVADDPRNVRVTEYEVLRPPVPGEDENQILQTVKIDYLFRDRQVVRSIVDQQKWEYHPDSNDWVRINPIPVFK